MLYWKCGCVCVVCYVFVWNVCMATKGERRKEKQITALLSTSQRCRTVITHMCDADASFRFVLCTVHLPRITFSRKIPHFTRGLRLLLPLIWLRQNNSGELKNQGINIYFAFDRIDGDVFHLLYREYWVWGTEGGLFVERMGLCVVRVCMYVCAYVCFRLT